ncbi:type III polyketide synthase [Acuticoccus sp.]|uniref:type III polyketide synthase n=1 Tax=Acuticoccus sp. TaxID=1904378 RepID=UPI003B51DE3D
MAPREAHINAISIGVPRHEIHHLFAARGMRRLEERQRAVLARTLQKSGIERRYSVVEPRPASAEELQGASSCHALPLDADGRYVPDNFPTTAERMRMFEREAPALAEATVRRLAVPFEGATHLVVCSCTGMAAPGVDLALLRRLGLAPSTQRTMVGFMGCYAAINALRLARAIVRSEEGARVLVVAVELCTLHMQETEDVERLLSFMIFADGCAAAMVTAEPDGLRIEDSRTALIPAADDLITWHVGDLGFEMRLSTRVPATLGDALPDAVASMVPGGADEIELWALHPGGKAVIDAVARSLALTEDAVRPSREVLRDYGNMSSPSVLFVMANIMAANPSRGASGLALAFGPGVTAEGLRFAVA